ncbi:MAG: sugar nucleotide-binding protein, partial [Treponema sp.]|nr:sugar nucleotide-binding protein [Treponema sp.]
SPKSPCNVYGKTKAEAETIISQTMTQYYIIRTSWLYGFYKENFVSAMVNLMNQNDSLQVIGDQFSRPTSCSDLAHFIITLIEKTENAKSLIGKNSAPANGIYHYANTGATSLYEFALAIFHYGKKHGKITNTCTIEPCPASEYKTMAQRPYNAILDTTKVEKQLKIKIPNWKTSLEQFIKNEEFKP